MNLKSLLHPLMQHYFLQKSRKRLLLCTTSTTKISKNHLLSSGKKYETLVHFNIKEAELCFKEMSTIILAFIKKMFCHLMRSILILIPIFLYQLTANEKIRKKIHINNSLTTEKKCQRPFFRVSFFYVFRTSVSIPVLSNFLQFQFSSFLSF